MAPSELRPVLRQMRQWVAARKDADATDAALLGCYLANHDEAAFTGLVRRHGPMVLGVARRVLGRAQDVEDVFQAVFLILARKAGAIRKREAVGSWLHGVAHRLALQARSRAARRTAHERQAAQMRSETLAPEAWQRFDAALDDALQSLPPRYRAVLLLCHAEGRTQEEAASQLGLPIGTVRSRLARGRELLRKRLTARGISLSSASLGILALAASARADFSTKLLEDTARAALSFATGERARTLVSSNAAALVDGALKSFPAAKLKAALALVLTFAVAMAGMALQQASRTLASSATNDAVAEVARLPFDLFGHDEADDLPQGAVTRLGTLRFRPGGMIGQLVFSPDGKTVISQGAYGASLMSAATGREIKQFSAGEWLPRRSATLSADGRWLAVAPGRKDGLIGDSPLQLWDCQAGVKAREFGQAPYSGVRFAPDGKTLAALRFDSVVEIWDPHAGRLIQSWKADEDKAYDLFFAARFTAGGKWLVTRNKAHIVRCWEVATGRRLWELKDTHTNTVFFDAASHGEVVALDATDYKTQAAPGQETVEAHVRLLDAGTGQELRDLVAVQKKDIRGLPSWFLGSVFSPDGKLLATSGMDRLIRLWDTQTGKQLRSWPFHPAVPGALSFGPDGKTLAIADAGSQVRLLNVEDGSEIAQPDGNSSGNYHAQFTPDGKSVLTLTYNATFSRWDAATGRLLQSRQRPFDKASISTLTRDGRTLFLWGSDQPVRQWDVATGAELRTWPGDYRERYPMSLLPSPDGKHVALFCQRPELDVLDTSTGKVCRLAGHAPWPFSGAFAPDGKAFVTWGADARVRVWDLTTARQLREIAVSGSDIERGAIAPRGGSLSVVIYTAAVSPDARLLAMAVPNRSLVIHDLASGREVRRFDQLAEDVANMKFAPDGRTLAWWSRTSATVHWLEVAGTGERRQFTGHRGQITGVAFADDGRRLLTTSEDTTSLIWDLMGPAKSPAALAPDDLAVCWAALGADSAKSWPAMRKLTAAPKQSVSFLRERLRPAPATDEKRVARLIADLNNDQFAVRKDATAELEKLGEAAIDACRQALDASPPRKRDVV